MYPDNGVTLQELTHKADNAMYKTKKQKPGVLSYQFFEAE
jgi:GGDEF domain-containing protein